MNIYTDAGNIPTRLIRYRNQEIWLGRYNGRYEYRVIVNGFVIASVAKRMPGRTFLEVLLGLYDVVDEWLDREPPDEKYLDVTEQYMPEYVGEMRLLKVVEPENESMPC